MAWCCTFRCNNYGQSFAYAASYHCSQHIEGSTGTTLIRQSQVPCLNQRGVVVWSCGASQGPSTKLHMMTIVLFNTARDVLTSWKSNIAQFQTTNGPTSDPHDAQAQPISQIPGSSIYQCQYIIMCTTKIHGHDRLQLFSGYNPDGDTFRGTIAYLAVGPSHPQRCFFML